MPTHANIERKRHTLRVGETGASNGTSAYIIKYEIIPIQFFDNVVPYRFRASLQRG